MLNPGRQILCTAIICPSSLHRGAGRVGWMCPLNLINWIFDIITRQPLNDSECRCSDRGETATGQCGNPSQKGNPVMYHCHVGAIQVSPKALNDNHNMSYIFHFLTLYCMPKYIKTKETTRLIHVCNITSTLTCKSVFCDSRYSQHIKCDSTAVLHQIMTLSKDLEDFPKVFPVHATLHLHSNSSQRLIINFLLHILYICLTGLVSVVALQVTAFILLKMVCLWMC